MEHTTQYYNEITDLVALFSDPSEGYSKGFTLNNVQFALLRVEDDKIIHGKGKSPKTSPVTIQKTGQAVARRMPSLGKCQNLLVKLPTTSKALDIKTIIN